MSPARTCLLFLRTLRSSPIRLLTLPLLSSSLPPLLSPLLSPLPPPPPPPLPPPLPPPPPPLLLPLLSSSSLFPPPSVLDLWLDLSLMCFCFYDLFLLFLVIPHHYFTPTQHSSFTSAPLPLQPGELLATLAPVFLLTSTTITPPSLS